MPDSQTASILSDMTSKHLNALIETLIWPDGPPCTRLFPGMDTWKDNPLLTGRAPFCMIHDESMFIPRLT